MNKVSILGCGWLGMPLLKALTVEGWQVKGSTTSEGKLTGIEEMGGQPYLLEITNTAVEGNLTAFLDSEILLINFPPRRREDIEEYFAGQMNMLLEGIRSSPVKHIIFVSSTSVYPNVNQLVDEQFKGEPEKASGKALLVAERRLMELKDRRVDVIRFGGLIGYDRMPGRFLAGKKEVPNGKQVVNLIHQDDCIDILTKAIQGELSGGVYNACCPEHPVREEFYRIAAEKIGMEQPDFLPSEIGGKRIDSRKLIRELNYHFKYQNPIEAL